MTKASLPVRPNLSSGRRASLPRTVYGKLDRFLKRRQPSTVMLIAFVFCLGVYAIDSLTGHEISFSIFYLGPIAMVGWYAGRNAGFVMSALSAIAWYVADWWGVAGDSVDIVPIWNGLVRFGFFLTVNHLLASLRTQLHDQEHLALTDALTGLPNLRAFLRG